MFLTLYNFLHSYIYPDLYVKCSFCLKFVLKSKVAYKTCSDCKKKQEDELSKKILEDNRKQADKEQEKLDTFILQYESN